MLQSDQEVLEYSLVKQTYSYNNKVQAAALENNTITLKAVLGTDAKETLTFNLKGLATGDTVTGEGITSKYSSSTKQTQVTLQNAKEGTYPFTIKTSTGSVNGNIVVVDVTMPTKVEFVKLSQQEDINLIEDAKIRENTRKVDSLVDNIANVTDPTFKGNVNAMEEVEVNGVKGKFYRARIKVTGLDVSKVKAVNKTTLEEYKTETIAGAPNELYIYLNANEATTNLVLKNVSAIDEQVKNAPASLVNEVKFNSISKIWVRDVTASSVDGKLVLNNIAKVEKDINDEHIIHVGVRFNNLPGVQLTEANGTVTATAGDEKWIPVAITLNSNLSNQNAIVNATYSDSEDIKINKVDYASSGRVVVWVKADQAGEKSFSLIYRSGAAYEELPLTVVLHDATKPEVVKATAGEVNSKGVVVTEKTKKTTSTNVEEKVLVDSYKYGMDVVNAPEGHGTTKGRWYSVIVETNVPVSSLVYSDGTNWAEIPERMKAGENQLVIWKNVDSTSTPAGIKIANRYAVTLGDVVSSANSESVDITIAETPKSKTELKANTYVGSSCVKNTTGLDNLGLTGVTVKEDPSAKGSISTLKHNLEYSKVPIQFDRTKENGEEKLTVVKLNSANVGEISVNGEWGKWILVHFTVRGNTDTVTDRNNNEKAIIVDAQDNGKLLDKYNDNGYMIVPLWINLSSDAVKAATTHTENGTVTPLEVKFGSSNPVEEENSFFLKVLDSNPNKEEVKASDPIAVDTSKYDNMETNEKNEQVYKDFFWTPTDQEDKDGRAAALLANMKVMENADIQITDTVDNTVYVSVKADLRKLQASGDNGNTTRVPLTFDVSSLGEDSDLIIARITPNGSGTNAVGNDNVTKAEDKKTCVIKINFKTGSQIDDLKSGKVTVELFFIAKNAGGADETINNETSLYKCLSTHKYIRYVVTFEQN